MKKIKTSLYIALSCSALQLPSGALAGGFQVSELCGRCAGSRIAGQAAQASGPATVWFNPAGLAKLDGVQLDFSLHYIVPKFEFSNINSTATNGDPAVGDPTGNGAENAVIPNFYASWRINERWALGFGMNAPYGTATEYDEGWIGRYHALRTELTTINMNPAFAFKVNDWLSLGAGLNAMKIDVELSNALDVGSIVNYAYGQGGNPAPGFPTAANPATDGATKATGEGWGWGWNIGALFSFNADATRLGINYRSQVSSTLDTTLDSSTPSFVIGPITAPPTNLSSKGETELDLPATLVLGFSHDFNDAWTLLAGGIWTQWSSFSEIQLQLDDGQDIVQPENWNDSWRWQLGAEFNLSPQWTFRAGYEVDYSPVDSEDNTARIPDADRQWLAMGASYNFRFGLSLDFAYSHIFLSDYKINEREVFTEQAGEILAERLPGSDAENLSGVANTLSGGYDSSADIFSLGLRYTF